MNNEHLGAATGGTPERPHAVILAWAIVTCRGPDGEETRHLVGRIASHARLSVDGEHDGEPNISSPLASMDLDARRAVNGRGKVIALQGDPLPPDAWPTDYQAMCRRAELAWKLPRGTTWTRAG